MLGYRVLGVRALAYRGIGSGFEARRVDVEFKSTAPRGCGGSGSWLSPKPYMNQPTCTEAYTRKHGPKLIEHLLLRVVLRVACRTLPSLSGERASRPLRCRTR